MRAFGAKALSREPRTSTKNSVTSPHEIFGLGGRILLLFSLTAVRRIDRCSVSATSSERSALVSILWQELRRSCYTDIWFLFRKFTCTFESPCRGCSFIALRRTELRDTTMMYLWRAALRAIGGPDLFQDSFNGLDAFAHGPPLPEGHVEGVKCVSMVAQQQDCARSSPARA